MDGRSIEKIDMEKLFSLAFKGSLESELNGILIIVKKNLLDLKDGFADLHDDISDLLDHKVYVQLVSHTLDPKTIDGRTSPPRPIEGWSLPDDHLTAQEILYKVHFSVEVDFGIPGAVLIKNEHQHQFYLKTFVLKLPDESMLYFPCNSWVYNSSKYNTDRIFFTNKAYLPSDTPAGLVKLRNIELLNLRGDGKGTREKWDRAYDYDTYNDLGNPDKNEDLKRPVLGGSTAFPFPRRCRTGRSPTKQDEQSESPLEFPSLQSPYVPRDEQFGVIKASSFLGKSIKATIHRILPLLSSIISRLAVCLPVFGSICSSEFQSFQDVRSLYDDSIDLLCIDNNGEKYNKFISNPFTLISELISDKENQSLVRYPVPLVIHYSEDAWMQDEEFGRQRLAGENPLVIQCLKEFPPRSSLDPAQYGPPESSITASDLLDQLEGSSLEQTLQDKRLFILDYYDLFMPYISRINELKGSQGYASRTLLFLTKEGTLKPVAIELGLPPQQLPGIVINRVFVPPKDGNRDWLWELAKAHVSTNDAGYHQLISHFLRTHAAIEPMIIATHRQLSRLHPINLLLVPHFKNTLAINAKARDSLVNAGGTIESNFTTGKYSMEISSIIYDETWRFDEEGLPADLIKRGMAVHDPGAKHGLKLTIEDYPYAADGLEVWSSIEQWVEDYVGLYYQSDEAVKSDTELQQWWTEVRTVGHGDKKDEEWWPKLDGTEPLIQTLTTIIWLSSAHHAAVNFGQYAYAGYMPNHPTKTSKLIPEPGSGDFKELFENPEKFFLSCLSSKSEATAVMTTIEILSTHSLEELYLGQPGWEYWSSDKNVLEAFGRFSKRMEDVEEIVKTRNHSGLFKNRDGPAKVPYTLLYPSSSNGLTGKGIPNSISI